MQDENEDIEIFKDGEAPEAELGNDGQLHEHFRFSVPEAICRKQNIFLDLLSSIPVPGLMQKRVLQIILKM